MLRILAQSIVQYVALVNIRQLQEEPVTATRVAALARTSVIPRLPPNTTKNPIVSCAVLVNIQHLPEEQQIAIHVPPASTTAMPQTDASTTKNPIASFAVLVSIPQPRDRSVATLAKLDATRTQIL